MFKPGQKVVCINDVFSTEIKKFYWKLPVNGVTYTIREIVPGCTPSHPNPKNSMESEVCVYLVELINPCSDMPPYPERGFRADRFRELDTTTETNEEELVDVIGGTGCATNGFD